MTVAALHRETMSPREEKALFTRLRLPGGIFKTTIADRLRDVDLATLAALGPTDLAPEVLDVGASSGSTSLDLLRTLRADGRSPTVTLTDISLTARLARLAPGYSALLTENGDLLLHRFLGVYVRPWRRRLDYITQFWTITGLSNLLFRFMGSPHVQEALRDSTPVLLLAPQVTAEPGMRWEEGDVFATCPAHHKRRFRVVRAANLLLPDVFGEARIRQALEQLIERLDGPGSVLVLARSPAPGQAGRNRATIYRVDQEGRLEPVSRLAGGVDIEALVPTFLKT